MKNFERDHLYWNDLWRKLEYICQTRICFFKDVKVSVVVNRVDFAGTDVVSMYKICGGY